MTLTDLAKILGVIPVKASRIVRRIGTISPKEAKKYEEKTGIKDVHWWRDTEEELIARIEERYNCKLVRKAGRPKKKKRALPIHAL